MKIFFYTVNYTYVDTQTGGFRQSELTFPSLHLLHSPALQRLIFDNFYINFSKDRFVICDFSILEVQRGYVE